MLTGPAPAAARRSQAGLEVGDVDLFGSTAFAAVAIRFIVASTSPTDRQRQRRRVAIGHPLGATGAIILGTLVDELRLTICAAASPALCVGGGIGIATIVGGVPRLRPPARTRTDT